MLLMSIQDASPETKFELLYRGSRDGWRCSDFHKRCDNQGPTLVLVKSSKDKCCGGYTSVSWQSSGGFKRDEKAFLFSLDELVMFSPVKPASAVMHAKDKGPSFGCLSLTLWQEPLNGKKHGWCSTDVNDGDGFQIYEDDNGNSILTGEGRYEMTKYFTCKELEVYKVIL